MIEIQVVPYTRFFRGIFFGCLVVQSAMASQAVTYEAFGAIGDGVTDDLPAIVKAHAHANENGLPVRTKPDATYHLGRQALTAIIQTDTDWGTSKFIIDDSQGVDDLRRPLFEVTSRLKPVPLKIERLTRGQIRLDIRPPADCLVHVENDKHRIFIRRGGNQNSGTAQQEVFILRRDGSIEGGIDWDYESVTRVVARPIDPKPLSVRGGIFTNIANRDDSTAYWGRNIVIKRSNTTIDKVTHRVTGETDIGAPYRGFLHPNQCANVSLRNCRIDGRKTYHKIGNDGTHDFGYPCFMPRMIRIEGLVVDDGKSGKNNQGVTLFGDPLPGAQKNRPFPIRLTERIEVSDLETTSGKPPRVSNNPEVAKAITVEFKDEHP